jgi:hypothetical protein
MHPWSINKDRPGFHDAETAQGAQNLANQLIKSVYPANNKIYGGINCPRKTLTPEID